MNTCTYRKLTNKEIISILESKTICSLGTSLENEISIIPMWYIFEENNSDLNIFFVFINSKVEINNIKNNKNVCISLNDYISNFYRDALQTIIVKGTAEIMTNLIYQNYILNKFMKKYNKSFKDFNCSNDLNYVKVTITSIEGREYNYDI